MQQSKIERRLIVALTLFVCILLLAPIGYMLIEKMTWSEAFYMTVITIFTVGFREVRPLSTAGMYFTISVIFLGAYTLFFIVSSLIQYTFRDAIRETFGRRRMDLRIKNLRGHYIVCGFGRMGEVVCETLAEAGADFVLVEKDAQRARDAADAGYYFIHGDATETETLEQAGVRRARGMVCALESDADNLFATLTARSLNPDIIIVSRYVSPDSVDKLRYAGADRLISPYAISGRRMATFILKPGVFDYLDLMAHGADMEYRMEELLVERGSTIDGKTIGELDIKASTGAMIIAVRKSGSEEFHTKPGKETRIEAGDLLIALGTEKDLAGLEKLALHEVG